MHAEMDVMQMTCDADHDFASMMIIHYQGAIDMANHLLEKGNDETTRAMAVIGMTDCKPGYAKR